MRRLFMFILAAFAVMFALPVESAEAHPLGNFTINQYSRIEIERDIIRVRYIVDMAEIPAFAERQLIDTDDDGALSASEQTAYLERTVPALVAGLHLTVAGSPASLRIDRQDLAFPPGQGGLATLRLELNLAADRPVMDLPLTISYIDTNFTERIGWREVIARAGDGVALRDSNVPQQDRSGELRSYPDDMLESPPDVRFATFTVAPGGDAGTNPPTGVAALQPSATAAGDPLTALLDEQELTMSVIAGALVLAFVLGAGHALTPGHGKTVAAAYLVGTRGTVRHAIALGLTTTITHTAGVFLLGIVTLTLSHYILPEQFYPWLELISGLLVVAIGLGLLRTRIMHLLRPASSHLHHHHGHDHHHEHDHDHHDHDDSHHHHHHGPDGHSHDQDFALADWVAGAQETSNTARPFGWRGLIALGISGGLLPCPSALVVLLGAIAVGRVGFGMLLIVAFSAGLAAVLTAIGLVLVSARTLFERLPTHSRLLRTLPVVSAFVVTCAGIAISAAALTQTGR